MLAFNGDVYEGFDANRFMRPISTTRRTMCACCPGCTDCCGRSTCCSLIGWKWARSSPTRAARILYAFWGDRITAALNGQMKKQRGARVLVNCASGEYFKSVQPKRLDAPVVTPVFQDWKNGQYKIISFHAKRARGLMARFAVQHRIDEPEGLKDFGSEGYAFDKKASTDATYVYRRRVGA